MLVIGASFLGAQLSRSPNPHPSPVSGVSYSSCSEPVSLGTWCFLGVGKENPFDGSGREKFMDLGGAGSTL